jgi:hypothetical protein
MTDTVEGIEELQSEFRKILVESQRNGRRLHFDENAFNNFLIESRFEAGDLIYRDFNSTGAYRISNLCIFRLSEKYIHFDKKITVKWGAGSFEIAFAEPMLEKKCFKFVLLGKYRIGKETMWEGQIPSISFFDLTKI